MRVLWPRVLCIVATTIAVGAIVVALTIGWGGPTPYCTKDAAQVAACASWVQAIFSIVAIFAAVAIPFAQHQIQAAGQRREAEAQAVGLAMLVIPHLRYQLMELDILAKQVASSEWRKADGRLLSGINSAIFAKPRINPADAHVELAANAAKLGQEGRRLQFVVMRLKTFAQRVDEARNLLHENLDTAAATVAIDNSIADALALRLTIAELIQDIEVIALRAPEDRTVRAR